MIQDSERKNSSRPEGRYANYFEVGHNAFEFLMDFGQFYSEGGRPQFHTRIVTSPAYAKILLVTLSESIDRYEYSFGNIPTNEGDEGPKDCA